MNELHHDHLASNRLHDAFSFGIPLAAGESDLGYDLDGCYLASALMLGQSNASCLS